MRVEEIKCTRTTEKYMGNSKSWKKAWRASMQKWKMLKSEKWEAKHGDGKQDFCGFCDVVCNIEGDLSCEECPVRKFCRPEDLFENTYIHDPDEVIQYLNDNKERIFNL